eukprot:8247635-Heterocapsa_arctica.AAC.1
MYYAFKQNYVTVNVSHMGMMEARAVFEGSCFIAGVPYESVPGQTMKDKRVALATMSYNRLKLLI